MVDEVLPIAVAQRIAASIIMDSVGSGAVFDQPLRKLARLGAHGMFPGNAERDFHRFFGSRSSLGFELRPWMINVPLQFPEELTPREVPFPVFAPHELFATLHSTHMLQKKLVGSVGSAGSLPEFLKTFWNELVTAKEPWVITHPAIVGGKDLSLGLPVFLHADETSAHKDSKVYFVSMSGLARGDVSRFLLAAIPCDKQFFTGSTNITLNRVFDFLVWSFEVLLTGMWPSRGFQVHGMPLEVGVQVSKIGCPLADGFYGICGGVKGDQKFHLEAFRWVRHAGCNNICRWCSASKLPGAFLWTNMSTKAAWKTSWNPLTPCGSLARLPGLQATNIFDDMFHLLWVQGVGNDLAGSALCILATHGVFSAGSEGFVGSAPRAELLNCELQKAFCHFKQWCRHHKLQSSAPKFTSKTVHCGNAKEFPHVNGKGADVRLVVLWLHSFLSGSAGFQGLACVKHQVWFADLEACVHNFAAFVHGISTCGVLLTNQEAANLKLWGEGFVGLYLGLASWACAVKSCLFKVRPKLHLFCHLVQRIRKLNPKMVTCMADESFMGVAGKIARGTHRNGLPLRTLQRYMQVLGRILDSSPLPVRGFRGFSPKDLAQRLQG